VIDFLHIYACITFSKQILQIKKVKKKKIEFALKLIFLTVAMSDAPNQAGVSSTSYITYHSGGHLDRLAGVMMVGW